MCPVPPSPVPSFHSSSPFMPPYYPTPPPPVGMYGPYSGPYSIPPPPPGAYIPPSPPTPPPMMHSYADPFAPKQEPENDEPELLVLCHRKKLAYAPADLMRTYDSAIEYIKQAFPSLTDTKRADFALYIDTTLELIRVPALAWETVFPTLSPRFGYTNQYVFVEIDGTPSDLPAFPFQSNVRQWFMPSYDVPYTGGGVSSWRRPVGSGSGSRSSGSNASTESLTARPMAPNSCGPAPALIPEDVEEDAPPAWSAAFVPTLPEPEPVKKRGFWSRLFGFGKKDKGKAKAVATPTGEKGSL